MANCKDCQDRKICPYVLEEDFDSTLSLKTGCKIHCTSYKMDDDETEYILDGGEVREV